MSKTSSFADAGFCIFDQAIIEPQLLQTAKARLSAILSGEFDRGVRPWGFANQHQPQLLQRIELIHCCDKAFFSLLVDSGVGAVIADAIGVDEIKVWGTQLYIKPPSDNNGANVGWHRDSQHVSLFQSGALTLWIPLDGSDVDCGPLSFVVGSHDKSIIANPSGAQQQDLALEQQLLAADKADNWQTEQVIVPQGGFSIHHWDLIHGSGQNHSDKTRYGLSVGIATEHLVIDFNQQDYGYLNILDNPEYCPILFKRD